MAKIHFYLRNKKDGIGDIVKRISYKGTVLQRSVGEKIPESAWDKKKERPRIGRAYREYEYLYDKLDDIEQEFNNGLKELSRRNKESITNIKVLFHGDDQNGVPNTFVAYFEYRVNQMKEKGQNITNMNNTLNRLKIRHPHDIEFEDINIRWYEDYVAWMQKQKWENKGRKGYYSKNTIGKDIGNVRLVLNYAKLEGVSVNDIQSMPQFKTMSETVYSTYLSVEEIIKLYKYDFSNIPSINRAAVDWWIIDAFTGLRISDGKRLTEKNITSDGKYIIQDMQKVNGRVEVPLHWVVKDILKRYNGLPPHVAEGTIRRHIKSACQLAGINDNVVITRTEGGKKITRSYEKWQVVSTHTARRSLATNMDKARIPIEIARKMTGHATKKQYLDYIKQTANEAAESIKDHPFWQSGKD